MTRCAPHLPTASIGSIGPFVVAVLVSGIAACGGSTEASASSSTDGGGGAVADAAVDKPSAEPVCFAVRSDGSPSKPKHVRYEYRTKDRILSTHVVDQPTLDAPPIQAESLYYRVDEDGYLVTYAGQGFRHDFARDQRHNVTQFRFVYEDWTDLTKEPTAAAYMAYDAIHHYDASGLLTSTAVDGSQKLAIEYTHDDQQRCSSLLAVPSADSQTLEARTYEAGRLAKVVFETTTPNAPVARRIVAYRYDDVGRVVAIEQDGGGHWQAEPDGTPDMVQYWTFAVDGSWVYDGRDYTTDTPNSSVEGRSCARTVIEFAPSCGELMKTLPKAQSNLACQYSETRKLPF